MFFRPHAASFRLAPSTTTLPGPVALVKSVLRHPLQGGEDVNDVRICICFGGKSFSSLVDATALVD